MTKKIIIFISVFLIVGAIVLTISSLLNKDTNPTGEETPWYQNFNPFGLIDRVIDNNPLQNSDNNDLNPDETPTKISRFYKITDFAVSGATSLTEKKAIVGDQQEERIVIDANTKEGRQEIQKILNDTLSLQKPLVTDGNFGKLSISAIEEFQKLKGLFITGKIDKETAPYFTKVASSKNEVVYEYIPAIRYVERTNGHLYKMNWDTKEVEKISNSTIPSIYEASINNTGESVIYRYLSNENNITTFLATLGTVKGEFLVENISDVSISPDKNKFFYLAENSNGVTGLIGTFTGSGREVVFNSPFTEWISQWTNQKIYLTTKASYVAEGSIFSLNTTNKTLTKILGGIKGLTTLVSPDGTYVLYSMYTQVGPKLAIFNTKDNTTKELDLYGLPEKCTWTKDSQYFYCGLPNDISGNQYPDIWYQGVVSFDDFFVKIDPKTGSKTNFANSLDETSIDAIRLFLDDKEENLFFINKKDMTLWSLNIK